MAKKGKYTSLNAWLNSPEGKNALGYDNFSYIEGLDDMKKVGFDVHNIKKSLSDYEAAARKAGFGRIEYITENGSTTVVCRPTDMSIKMDDSECPSLEIGHIEDGFYVHNNMPTANNPVFVNNAGGMAGIASALSISIAEAAKNVSDYSNKWIKEYKKPQQIAQKIKTTTRISAEAVTHLNPSVYSKHVVGDYNSSINPQNMDALAVEGQAMILQQGMTSYYNHSLFNKHKDKMTGYKGAPKDEKTFTRQLESIMNVARGSDFKKLDSYVRNTFPWIYENVWKGDLQNFYKSLELAGTKSGNRITQGGKKEGAPSIIGLGKDMVPLASFLNAGRKPQQNLRYNPNKLYHDAANAKNKTFDKNQYNALKAKYGNKVDRIQQDLYFAGEINDTDFDKALIQMEAEYAEKIKNETDAKKQKALKSRLGLLRKELVTKGLGKDASLMSATATKDFRGMRYVDYLKGEVSKEVVDEKIKERLTKKFSEQKRYKGNAEEIAQAVDTEFNKLSELKNGKMSGNYKREIKKALHSLYGLDSLAKIGTFDFGDGKTFKNIQTIEKLDNNIFTARGGVTDDRTVSSAIADEILGYLFQAHGYRKQDIYKDPNDESKGLKMHIGSQQSEISEKNIRDHILRKWNYIVANADTKDIQAHLQNNNKLKSVFKYIAKDKFWSVDDTAALKAYGGTEDKSNPFDFLQDVVKLGQELGVYKAGDAFSLVEKDGKKTIVQNMALPEARERHVFSGNRYQGAGAETHSGSKFDWKVVNSMRGQLGQMERMGVDQKAIDAYRTYLQKIESELAHKESEYKSYVRNLQVISKTYGSDIDQFVKNNEKLETTEIISLQDLMKYNSELAGAYENNGYVQGIKFDDKQLAVELKKRQQNRYDDLKKKYGVEALQEKGIFSARDISVLADLGEGNDIGHYDYDNNKFYHSRYVAFGSGDFENKNGYMTMDDIGTENYRIANALKEYYNSLSGPNSKEAAERASRAILESHTNIAESVERGSIFEKFHTVTGDASSGYMLLSALGNNFTKNFTDKYNTKHAPSMIISTQDAEAMLRSALLGNDKNVKEAVYEMYANAFGGTAEDAKGITDINKIIKPLIEKYDYSRGGYKGDIMMGDFQFLRNPVIKFAADQLGGGLVFSSDKTVANVGSMRVNPDLAAAAKGDMDGDRVAFYIAAMTGDTAAAREALVSYYEHLAKNQELRRKAEEGQNAKELEEKGVLGAVNTGDLSKATSIMDYYTQNVRSIAMNEGAKGAGIYGDLLFALEKIFEDANINQGASGKNKEVFLANMASNVAHTLYQEGIAIKNIRGTNGEVLTDESEIAKVINEIVERSSHSSTWTTRRGMTDFLELLERTGMTETGGDPKNPLKGVFKGNIIANLGLNNLTSSNNDQEIVNLLDTVAQNEIKKFENEKDSDEYKRLNEDLKRIKALKGKGGDLGNISRELLVALITDDQYGLARYLGKDWGDKIVQRYKYIPGKTHEFERMLLEVGANLDENSLSDDVKKNYSKEISMAKRAAKEAIEKDAERYGQLRKATEISEFSTSPSQQTNKVAYSDLYGEGKDTRPFEELVKELLDPRLSEEEKSKKKLALEQQFGTEKYKELILSQMQGTYSHLAAEHYLTTGNGANLGKFKKTAPFYANMQKEIEKRGLDTESIAILKALGMKTPEARDFLEHSKKKGAANAAFLATIMEREGGQFIGSEVNLAGAGAIDDNGKVQLSRQIADAIYKTYNEETGKTVFHTVDFKNTKDGKPKLANLLQITDYIESLKALNTEILESGGNFSAGAYINKGRGKEGNIYQKMWYRRLKEAADYLVKEQNKTENEAWKEVEAQFKKLTDNLGVENAQFVGDIISQDEKGVMGRHSVRSLATNPNTRAYYEAYREGSRPKFLNGKSVQDVEKELIDNKEIIELTGTVFGGEKDDFVSLFSKEYQDLIKKIEVLKKLKEVEAELNSKLNIEKREVNPNAEKINDLERQLGEAQNQVKGATDEVDKAAGALKHHRTTDIYGRVYKFGEKDLNKTVESMTDTTEYEKFLNAQEVAAAKDQLADYNVELKKVLKQIMMLERESKKEGLSESTKRVLERNMAYGQINFAETLGRYAEVYGLASKDIDAKGSEKEKAWLKEMDFSIGGTNLEAFKEQTNKELDLEERKKSQRFFNYALEQYTKLEKLNTEIRQTTEAKNTAEVNGDEVEVELLSKKIALLKEELQIRQQTLKVEQFSSLDGYTKKLDEDAKRLAKLDATVDEKRAKKQSAPKQQSGGSSGGGDFLGIDSYTTRWLSRIMQGGTIAYFIRIVRKGLKDITEKAKQLDQAMTNLRIVTGKNAENARTLITSYAKLGKELGATTIEVTTAATAWLRQGYEISQVNDLITATMYLSKLGMIDTATATKDLTSAMKGFKLEASDAMKVVDKLTALDVKAATTAGDVAEGLSQFANIANLNGVSIDQASAYVATIADVTQASGTTVGQALKTILSRYGNVKAGAYNKLNVDSETGDTDEKLNDVERVLTKMGISIRKTNLEFKDFDEVLDEIAGKWQTMDNVSKKAIANAFAGIRQQENFLTLMENYNKYQELLDVSESSAGTAERKYQSYKESYVAAKNEFTAALEQVANSSEISKLLTGLLEVGKNIVEGLQKIIPLIPGFISVFASFRTWQGKSLLQTGYRMLSSRQGQGQGRYGQAVSNARGMTIKNPFSLDSRTERVNNKLANEEYKSSKEKLKLEHKQQALKDKYQKQEMKYRKQAVEYSKRELEYKKSILSPAEREVLKKKAVVDSALMESLRKEGVAREGQEELTYEEGIAILESGILANKKVGAQLEAKIYGDREAGQQSEDQIAAKRAAGKINEAGGIQASKGTVKGAKVGAVLGMVSSLSNMAITSLSQFQTAATTHDYKGETVESSKEAQRQAASVSAAISTIPLIGGFLGPWIADGIAASIDKARDQANYETKKANERSSQLSSISSSLDAIGNEEIGSAQRHKLVQQFKEDLFDESNKEMRGLLQKRLGNKNISSLLSDIDSNTEKSEEALRELKTAQIEASKQQVAGKYSSTIFEEQQSLSKALAEIEGYDGGATGAAWGKAGITGIGVGGGILTGALAGAAIGSSATPIGTAIGAIIGGIVGLVTGLVAGNAYEDAVIEDNKSKYKSAVWDALNTTEKIDFAQEKIDFYTSERFEQEAMKKAKERYEKQYGDNGLYRLPYNTTNPYKPTYDQAISEDKKDEIINSYYEEELKKGGEILSEMKSIIEILERQETVEHQIFDEFNELTLQEAMVNAKITDSTNNRNKYLSNMSIAELKHLGIDKILTSFADSIEASGGLIGMNVWNNAAHTELSELGYDYLLDAIKKQGDEEINAVLSGQSYTLEEALELRDKFPNSYQAQKILSNFATALGVTVDKLDTVVDKVGKLTLAEDLMSTTELHAKIDEYNNLLSSVASGGGEVSNWMETIIKQFPDLIYYMNDTSELFTEAVSKLKQYSEAYANAQYDEMMSSPDLFKKLEKDLYDGLDETTAASLREKNVSSLADVMNWVNSQYNGATNTLPAEAQKVMDKVVEIVKERGLSVVNGQLKAYYDMIIDYQTKVIDTEVSNLESQKDMLKEINSQREYENKLIEAKLKLEDAEKQKKRVYRAGVGWVYESDQAAIEDAQKQLKDVENEKTISKLEEQITTLQNYKEELQSIYDKYNFEQLEKINEAAAKEGDVGKTINDTLLRIESKVGGIETGVGAKIVSNFETDTKEKAKAVGEVQTAWENLNNTSPSTEAYNTALEVFHNKMNEAIDKYQATQADFANFQTYGYNYSQDQKNTSRITSGLSAWDVGQGDIAKQKTKAKSYFMLNDFRNESGTFQGVVNGDTLQNSSDAAGWVWEGVKKGRALIWTDKAPGGTLTNSAAYQAIDSDENLSDYLKRISESDLTGKPSKIIVSDPEGENESVYYENGNMWKVVGADNTNGLKYDNGPGIRMKQDVFDVAVDDFANVVNHLEDYIGFDKVMEAILEATGIKDALIPTLKQQLMAIYEETGDYGAFAEGTLGLQKTSLSLINEKGTEAIITPQGTLTALPSSTGIVPADITKNLWELGEVAPSLLRVLGGTGSTGVVGSSIFDRIANDESFNISNLTMNVDADSTFDVDKFINSIKSRVALTKNSSR